MHLRIIVPAVMPSHSLPVVYLLHGAGQDYRDWSNHSEIAAFSAHGIILVMPDEPNAYYINEVSGSTRHYEDYFVEDVIPEVHRLIPNAANDRAHNAIVGISRGGYGAAVIALRHPQLFSFVGDLSGAVDFPERSFRWQAPVASFNNRQVFGAPHSAANKANDPFVLIHQVSQDSAPYFFIICGKEDPLFEPNQRFAAALQHQGLQHEFHALPGGHNWNTWSEALPMLETSLLANFGAEGSSHKP
jgi:putative tributyrin esterase